MLLNDKHYVVPMVMEEPSVVAAQSAGAKLIGQNGGITGSATKRKMIGQIELISVSDIQAAKENIIANEEQRLLSLTKLIHRYKSVAVVRLKFKLEQHKQRMTKRYLSFIYS